MDDDAAARWAIRLDNGSLTPDEQAALDDWLRGDERRSGALLRAEAMLAYLDRGRALAEVPVDVQNDNDRTSWTRRGLLKGGSAVAGVMAIGVTGFLWWRSDPIEVRTALGEIRRVPLPDGSVALINTASDIAVAMADERRDVKLRNGEAWFQVVHDRRRPFIVAAGRVRVRAVGTSFAVRRREDGADILVTEGVVETWVAGGRTDRIRIAAGSRGFVSDHGGSIETMSAAETIDRSLSWRTGNLALNGESLRHAVEELNRYNSRKIIIDSPALGQEPVVGYFRVDQPDEFAQAIGATMGATVQMEADAIHLLR